MKSSERINIGVVLRIILALLPLLFGMPTIATVFCAYMLAMFLLTCGPLTFLAGALSSVVVSMLLFSGTSEAAQLDGLFLSVEAILCALACAITIMQKKKFSHGVFLASAAYLVPSFINISNQASKAGLSVAQMLTQLPVEFAKFQLEELSKSADIDLKIVTEAIDMLSSIAEMMVPSVLVVSSVVVGYIMMWTIALPFRKSGDFPPYSFSEIRFPRASFVVSIISAILWFVVYEDLKYIFANVVFILCTFAFFSGMSLVDFFLRKRIKNIFTRLIIHVALYMVSMPVAGINPFISIFTVYILLAVVDSFINIRKRTLKTQEEELEEV